jgi:membrane protein
LLAFIFGLVASVLLVAISYSSSNKTITILSVLMSSAVALQYLILGAYGATALSVLSIVFAVAALLLNKKPYWRFKNIAPVIVVSMTALFLMTGGSLSGFSLFPLVGSVLMSCLVLVENKWAIKAITFVAGIVWLVYQIHTGAWGQIPGQIFYFTFWFISVGNMVKNTSVSKRILSLLSRSPKHNM